ncbi:hypothetical protein TNCV_3218691 [Trichonephila clavipes]|nr:hypothetical protein TNCV_3218691 [Trichonephila clavipes]
MSTLITLSRRPEIPLNFPVALPLPMLMQKLAFYPVKKRYIPELKCNHIIPTTIAGLSTRQSKGRITSPDGQGSYNTCHQCPDIQLSPNHNCNCLSIFADLHNINLNPMDHRLLYWPKVFDIARAVLNTFRTF